jgi:hypothetical protein
LDRAALVKIKDEAAVEVVAVRQSFEDQTLCLRLSHLIKPFPDFFVVKRHLL